METIAGGTTALIKLYANGTYVEKAPYPDSRDLHYSTRDLKREYKVYRRLPDHPRILKLHPDSSPERLVLPYLKNGCLHEYLRASAVSTPQRIQFAADAAEGLHILHSGGIIHGDISSWNFLVDNDLRLCIIDFAGSTFDGLDGSAFEGVRYSLPRLMSDPSNVRTDLFALGSLIFEIMTSQQPYQDAEDDEVVRRFEAQTFPCTRELCLGQIISKCWRGSYKSAHHVYEDIRCSSADVNADGGRHSSPPSSDNSPLVMNISTSCLSQKALQSTIEPLI